MQILYTLIIPQIIYTSHVIAKPQNSYAGTPFKLKTNFLQQFMEISEMLFPYSSSSSSTSRHFQPTPPKEPELQTSSSDSVLVKRKVSHDHFPRFQTLSKTGSLRRNKPPPQSLSDQLNDLRLNPDTREQMRNILRNRTKEINQTNNTNIITADIEIPTSTPHIIVPNTSFVTSDIPILKIPQEKENAEIKLQREETKTSFLGLFVGTLTKMPIIGNILKATVDPLYRPIVNRIQSRNELGNETISEEDMKDWCFEELGCLHPTSDFFHFLYRPVNLPPYRRERVNVLFTIHSRDDRKGFPVSWNDLTSVTNTSFMSNRPTKFLIHGFLHNRHQSWVSHMIRGLLQHGDYNVITVDWSSGSHALYSQATANARLVGLEVSHFIKWLQNNTAITPDTVHIIGHSLGAHISGYAGEKIPGLGRITGLDPAEPYFQYMPESVRLDPSDALFVDVIHTDMDSFFAITGPRGFGLQQAVGHVDFYPNGGHDQPGCNSLLTRVPLALITEGEDIGEGINAAQTELVQCDHIRAPRLFTDSLISNCPYLGFACESYTEYRQGNCFTCGKEGEKCVSMGINADRWNPENKTHIKVFLDTHIAPNFCMYHYLLTIDFADPYYTTGTLRGRLQVTFITDDGELKKFDLTSLAPQKFPRRGSRTFMLEHYEDISGSQEALLSWTFESDLLNPTTFCVIFCRADLSIASISFISVDTGKVAEKVLEMGRNAGRNNTDTLQEDVVMCQPKGQSAMIIPNGSTVKMSSSSSCKVIRESAQKIANSDLETDKIHHVPVQL